MFLLLGVLLGSLLSNWLLLSTTPEQMPAAQLNVDGGSSGHMLESAP